MKAKTGGSGIRQLVPLHCSESGYNVQLLKEQVRASTIYIIPMNSAIDETPESSSLSLTRNPPITTAVCFYCGVDVPLISFQGHKSGCTGKDQPDFEKDNDSLFDSSTGKDQPYFEKDNDSLLDDSSKWFCHF